MSALTLLIVDDDLPTVDMISEQIDWKRLGISTVLRAYNGQAAINLIDQHRPEIILCDIGMPVASGFDVLTWINERQIPTCFIFLTCHDSFEFAREAIHLHAYNYLTKPFALSELISVLSRVIAEQPWTVRTAPPPKTIPNLFQGIYHGEFPPEKDRLRALFQNYHSSIELEHTYHIIFSSVDLDKLSKIPVLDDTYDRVKYGIRHMLRKEIIERSDGMYSFSYLDGSDYVNVLFADSSIFTREKLYENCQKALDLFRFVYGSEQTFLICDPLHIWEIYDHREALERQFAVMKMRNLRLAYSDELDQNETSAILIRLDEKMLYALMRAWDINALLSYLDQYLDQVLMANPATCLDAMRSLHQTLLRLCYDQLREYRLEPSLLLSEAEAAEIERNAEMSKQNMLDFATYLLSRLHEIVADQSDNKSVVDNAIAFIEENYTMDISRAEIARAACVTPNYLSKLFREKTDLSIREYINRCRFSEVTRRLLETDESVGVIAVECGFNNISYFSTLFRKYYGGSPLVCRKRHRK